MRELSDFCNIVAKVDTCIGNRRPVGTDGEVAGQDHLRRADAAQARMIADVFESPVVCRYSEILFKPEFALSFIGKYGAWLGRLDACLSGETVLFAPLARQRSFHTRKPA